MTGTDPIEKLIVRLSPDAVCDDCLAELGKLPSRNDARKISTELAGIGGFERKKAQCCMCSGTKQVIRKIR